MQNLLKQLFCLTFALQLMVGCSVFQTPEPLEDLESIRNQRSANALLAVLELENIDALVKLDNKWLGKHFETVLKTQAELGESHRFRNIRTIFNNQIITIEAIIDVNDEDGNTLSATLTGDILLKYGGKGLEWWPRFGQLVINSKEFDFAGKHYTEADNELVQSVLQGLGEDITEPVITNNRNTIALNPVPLGEIQVGATLPGFIESSARATRSLSGVFMIAGSALLIDSVSTSIALDMTFVPDLSTCPADVSVSRSVFARDIVSREPVDIARNVSTAGDVGYFYSEITGAKKPLTIIHYWFADGMPMTASELAVGPSERWRTWSARNPAGDEASHWEVLVVEKETGCILAYKSIRTHAPEILLTRVGKAQADRTFDEFKNAFSRRTSGFSIVNEETGIAQVEIKRPFLRDVLKASLEDLSIDAVFDDPGLPGLKYTAGLQAPDSSAIICEQRDCPQAPICSASLIQCKRLRDTRDCSSCKFRNPLNNRCVSQAIDPLCEAARNRQNARYDNERAACISRAEDTQSKCERLNAQVISSCQIEAGLEESACESIKSSLSAIDQGETLALVSAQARTTGSIIASFSNFNIEGDLDRLKLDLNLKPNLQMEGELSFEPNTSSLPLSRCITAWSASFKSRFTTPVGMQRLVNNFEQGPSMLTARWSGFGIDIDAQHSPLESIFVDNPQLLANCNIGLTVNEVEQALADGDAAFFRGKTSMIIHPLPTKINLAPASIVFGNMVYSAEAVLSSNHLRYDIRE